MLIDYYVFHCPSLINFLQHFALKSNSALFSKNPPFMYVFERRKMRFFRGTQDGEERHLRQYHFMAWKVPLCDCHIRPSLGALIKSCVVEDPQSHF